MPNDVLQEVGKAITELPKDFSPHRLIKKLYQNRRDMITGDPHKPVVDWGTAEALAFGTLISEGESCCASAHAHAACRKPAGGTRTFMCNFLAHLLHVISTHALSR